MTPNDKILYSARFVNKRKTLPSFLSSVFWLTFREKVVDLAVQKLCQTRQKDNIGIADLVLPFADGLRRDAQEPAKFGLRQLLCCPIFFDPFCNQDL